MGVTRAGKGSRELPEEMRRRVAQAVEDEIALHFKGKSERAIARAFGLSQPALNQIRNMKGALGLHALIAIRKQTNRSIDDLLGLPDLRATAPPPAPKPEPPAAVGLTADQIRTLLREELQHMELDEQKQRRQRRAR